MLAGPHLLHGAGAPPPARSAQGCRSLSLGGASSKAQDALPSGGPPQRGCRVGDPGASLGPQALHIYLNSAEPFTWLWTDHTPEGDERAE